MKHFLDEILRSHKRRSLCCTISRHTHGIQAEREAELDDAQMFHSISSMLVDEDNTGELYQKLVDVATRLMRSDFGSMQRFDEARGKLQLIAAWHCKTSVLRDSSRRNGWPHVRSCPSGFSACRRRRT